MITVPIGTKSPYPVLIGEGILDSAGRLLADVHAPCRAAVVTDSNVAPLYAPRLEASLRQSGFTPCRFTFPAGEASKQLSTFSDAVRFLAGNGVTRADLVITLGGGVAGDLGGFAAACWQRGISFAQVPTSLLCAVDASVGGKTAVDLPEGKNLVGAFHQPCAVICDPGTFQTLDSLRMADGAAESVKHGLIADAGLFSDMKSGAWRQDLSRTVERNVLVKRAFVVGDEHDRGQRQLLNFGHTIGHAVEALSDYQLSHGQAVAIGMAAETRAARRMGFGSVHEDEVIEALDAAGLPHVCPFSSAEVEAVALGDKKRAGDTITVGALRAVGEGFLEKLDLASFRRFVALGVDA